MTTMTAVAAFVADVLRHMRHETIDLRGIVAAHTAPVGRP